MTASDAGELTDVIHALRTELTRLTAEAEAARGECERLTGELRIADSSTDKWMRKSLTLTADMERMREAAGTQTIPVNDEELVRIRNRAELSDGDHVKIWSKMLITLVDGIRNMRALAAAARTDKEEG